MKKRQWFLSFGGTNFRSVCVNNVDIDWFYLTLSLSIQSIRLASKIVQTTNKGIVSAKLNVSTLLLNSTTLNSHSDIHTYMSVSGNKEQGSHPLFCLM